MDAKFGSRSSGATSTDSSPALGSLGGIERQDAEDKGKCLGRRVAAGTPQIEEPTLRLRQGTGPDYPEQNAIERSRPEYHSEERELHEPVSACEQGLQSLPAEIARSPDEPLNPARTIECLQRELSIRKNDITMLEVFIAENMTRVADLGQENSRLTQAFADARKERDECQSALDRKAVELAAMRERAAQAEAVAVGLQRELTALFHSTSWRVIRPLRWMRSAMTGLERHAVWLLKRLGRPITVLPVFGRVVAWGAVLIDARRIRAAGLFDPNWYLQQNPDVQGAGINPLLHYLHHGAAEGRDPNPLFDTDWYLQQNPDVEIAGTNPLVHYLRYGASEGRAPSPGFDGDWYLRENPDIRAAGMNPLAHYLRYGAAEGRVISPPTDVPPLRQAGRNVSALGRLEDLKENFRKEARAKLAAFLNDGKRIKLPTSDQPHVSILISLFNQAELTFECLTSLVQAIDIPSEVILVDNGSSDETAELCTRVDGARLVRNAQNIPFLMAMNQVAPGALGSAVLLLNNDTQVMAGSIGAAFRLLESDPGIGAVGGKLITLDGNLQEAGSIIWNDGSCAGYGRGRNPSEPEFQFRRDVDYCSGAFLLIRRSLFEQLNWFDPIFVPAYYEETDLCMRIHAAGYRIVYEPEVEVRHFEFGTWKSAAATALQAANCKVFVERHRDALRKNHRNPAVRPLEARMNNRVSGRILVIDDRVPYPTLGAGYPRANAILNSIYQSGWFVTFYPLLTPDVDWNEAYRILPAEIEIMAGYGQKRLETFLRERLHYYDRILVSRAHNMSTFLKIAHHIPDLLKTTSLVYDAEALLATREALRLSIAGRRMSASSFGSMMAEEMRLAKLACAVIAVNEKEAAIFRKEVDSEVYVVGHSLTANPTSQPFEKRHDILFVGALDDDDSPNVDSLVWFVRSVMPLLDSALGGDYCLNVIGRNKSRLAKNLAGSRVRFFGRLENIDEFYWTARIFVAPTRYAAGVPFKVHAAAAAGVPVVATPVLAEQLGWTNGVDLLTGGSAEEFSAACHRLYTDEALWQTVRNHAITRIKDECDPANFSRNIASLLIASGMQ